jgi:UDP-2,3-diacylglucosamine hydrolase
LNNKEKCLSNYHQIQISLTKGKKIYFASDLHLGAPNYKESRKREAAFVNWLSEIENDAEAIFLVGDVFDFWFEYKQVVPKGFVRLLGKLASITDKGIPIYIFTGNHDLWMEDYFANEIGAKVLHKPAKINCQNKLFFIGHGDGLGPGDTKFKIFKKIFTNHVCKWLFRWLHPDIGIKIALIWSKYSHTKPQEEEYLGDDSEFLVQYVMRKSKTVKADYFIFGHRHIPMEKQINKSIYVNLGEWFYNKSFASFDGEELKLEKYEKG